MLKQYINQALKFAVTGLIASLAASVAEAKLVAGTCPIERALYAQAGNPNVVAGFSKQGQIKTNYTSELVFWVEQGNQKFWFGFSAPNGYGGTYIYPRIDPKLVKPAAEEGDTADDSLPVLDAGQAAVTAEGSEPAEKVDEDTAIEFDAFDAKLIAFERVPQLGDTAPQYLYSRGLGPLFHYAHNGNVYRLSEPVKIDIAVWRRLNTCGKLSQ